MNAPTVPIVPTPPAGIDSARLLREEIRAGRHATVTTGLAPGHVQANLAILPADWADEFAAFCAANPKPCPMIARSEPGDPALPGLGVGIDVRRDLPRYRVFRDGVLASEETDISHLWRDDLVAFALGCSYSFEAALLEAGVPIRHIEQGKKVCTYRTGLDTVPAGRLHGKMVVSMRNFTVPNAIRAIEITSRFPRVHGAPIHFGDPAAIGIADIDRPEFGGEPDIRAGEVPLFWACGVTPQTVIEAARPPFCITHKAGHMLITDRLNEEFRDAVSVTGRRPAG
ncbi:putative hydro-lyase [Reyranella sp.]|uniref:putative hydro-lyase n=1 Tax=Reyranella sp. TaxID=1929291 RepID=UPI003782DB0C